MLLRNAVHGSLLITAALLPTNSGHSARAAWQPRVCEPSGPSGRHGELTKPLSGAGMYSYEEFKSFAESREWKPEQGVDSVRRRGDCGAKCVFKGKHNARDDEPLSVAVVSNVPICDANRVAHLNLPALGVLIGRITLLRNETPQGPPPTGDGNYNVGTGRFAGRPAREPHHYMVITPGAKLIHKQYFAMWKLVALYRRQQGLTNDTIAVVDSGLFSVCLPQHPMPAEPLASFRSCAEVTELHSMSRRTEIQAAILDEATRRDTTRAQQVLFSLLVRADPRALDALLKLPDSVLFRPERSGAARDQDPGDGLETRGPFAGASETASSIRRWILQARYGELHPDATAWYTCDGGCCVGNPM